jgi:hypothetical protein
MVGHHTYKFAIQNILWIFYDGCDPKLLTSIHKNGGKKWSILMTPTCGVNHCTTFSQNMFIPIPTKRHYVMPPFVKVHTYLQTSNGVRILLRMPKESPCHWMWQLDYDKIADGPFQRFLMDLLLEGQKYIQIHKDHMCNCVPSHLQHGNGRVDLHWQEFKIGLCCMLHG